MADKIAEIDTPAFVVDEVIAKRNIKRFQEHCEKQGLALRPHIKTHKTVHFAKVQMDSGAVGITCQKISEAEVMADGGIDDILITYNIIGEAKLQRLRLLADRVKKLSVTADSAAVIKGLNAAFENAENPLTVLIECDTGAGRCGVQSPDEAAELALLIKNARGLKFGGLMTYPAVGGQPNVAKFMRAAVDLLKEKGISCPVVSSGGSPDMWSAKTDGVVTEYRIGTYIYNDRSLVENGSCDWDDCAGHVLATIVSIPAKGRAIIDAGSKVLTSDLLGFSDYGHIVERPDIKIIGLSEEHGTLKFDPEKPLEIGQKLKIVPNHVCVVSNMFDRIWLRKENGRHEMLTIDARGMVL
jgi:D-serine deaminase-like pyridoxal phosphate-dependent protein